jgi:hypothetical protein
MMGWVSVWRIAGARRATIFSRGHRVWIREQNVEVSSRAVSHCRHLKRSMTLVVSLRACRMLSGRWRQDWLPGIAS